MKFTCDKIEVKVIQDSGRFNVFFDTISVKNARAGVVFGRSLQATPEYMLLKYFSEVQLASCDRLHLVGTCGPIRLDMHLKHIGPDDALSIGAEVTNISSDSIRLWRVVLIDGDLAGCLGDYDFLEYSGPLGTDVRSLGCRESVYGELRALYSRIGVRWNLALDPVYDAPNWHVSRDFGGIVNSRGDGLYVGFYSPARAFGDVCVNVDKTNPRLVVSALMDGICLGPGEARECEEALLVCGAGERALSLWADKSAEVTGVRQAKSLTGWCSWYSTYGNVNETNVLQAVEEFSAFNPCIDVIQVDDGFQRTTGDWRVNQRFPSGLKSLARMIHESGFIPGIWLAPTAVHETSPVYIEHPDWIQRLPDGTPAVSFGNWGQDTYFLDPTLPEARDYMAGIIREFTEELGFRYLKIDFTSALATGAVYYDSTMTRFEMLRSVFQLFRETAGDDVYINACLGEVVRGVAGFVDASRIGPDVTPAWDETLANAMKCAVIRSNINGRWWVNDPDVVYLRHGNSRLSLEERRFALTVAGLTGGLLFTSDLPSSWDEEAGYAFGCMTSLTLREVVVDQITAGELPGKLTTVGDDYAVIAILQWDREIDHCIDLKQQGYFAPVHVFELWTSSYMGIHQGTIRCLEQPIRSSRIYYITPVISGVQVVGSSINLVKHMKIEYSDEKRCRVWLEGGGRRGTLFIRCEGKIRVSSKDASIEELQGDVWRVSLDCQTSQCVEIFEHAL